MSLRQFHQPNSAPTTSRQLQAGLVARPRGWVWALLVLTLGMSNGCVRRRLTVRSDPPGALVYIDDQEIGVTPVSTSFTYYGNRKVQLVRDGHETVTQVHAIKRPWYQYPVIEFFAENVYPAEIRDERELQFQLAPQRLTNIPRLIERGEEMRSNMRHGVVTPLPDEPALPQPTDLPPPTDSVPR